MEKWGLGYEEVLSKKFPRLVHCRISGFGADGPYGGFPGYDGIIQAMVGHFFNKWCKRMWSYSIGTCYG
jgi:Predicted acyl-CoA transferases/carnitine dehydratase